MALMGTQWVRSSRLSAARGDRIVDGTGKGLRPPIPSFAHIRPATIAVEASNGVSRCVGWATQAPAPFMARKGTIQAAVKGTRNGLNAPTSGRSKVRWIPCDRRVGPAADKWPW
jgi:hypothetical protein